jgi:hypothetical protein
MARDHERETKLAGGCADDADDHLLAEIEHLEIATECASVDVLQFSERAA